MSCLHQSRTFSLSCEAARAIVKRKERCLRCDASWERDSTENRHPCVRCGEPQWDTEISLDSYIGARNEYEIVRESVDQNLVITLELQAVHFSHAPIAPLSHRLKNKYRHAKADLSVKDGRGLIIVFEQAVQGPEKGLWVIGRLFRKPEAPAASGTVR